MAEEKNKSIGAKLVQGVVSGAKTVTNAISKHPERRAERRVKLLFGVVNRGEEGRLKEIVDECSVALGFGFAGTGTAHSAVLDYLGIGQTEKALVCALIPETDEDLILKHLRTEMSLYLVGKGIAFTIPLSGVSERVASGLTGAATEKSMEGKKRMIGEERKYDLIVAALAVNHIDEAMDAARAAGAAGGTIVRALSASNAKAEQFIGINLLSEREILLILAKREGKLAIMQALNEKVGLKTEAGGVIFSLPVDKTAGISAADEQDMRSGKTDESNG